MNITDHILDDVEYIEARSHGGVIIPKFLVMHYTAGWKDDHAISIFKRGVNKVSAHIVLGTDGKITQMLPFNVKGHHVGSSYHKGHSGLNSHSIGIEVVNYGDSRMFDEASDQVLNRRGRRIKDNGGDPENWIKSRHHLHGGANRYWQKFTDEQFEVLDELVPLLVYEYNLREVVGHEEVATPKGRKPDPGPAFPLEHYKEYADFANAESEGRYIVVGTDHLNCRGGPGTRYEILTSFKKGDSFKVIDFDGKWALIEFDTKRGWVHSSFIMRA